MSDTHYSSLLRPGAPKVPAAGRPTEIEKMYEVAIEQVGFYQMAVKQDQERLARAILLREQLYDLLPRPEKTEMEFHE